MDWNDLRLFLAVAKVKTLSEAAKHLRVTQSTLGRRLASLEASMGVRLLQRVADGYELTLAGEAVPPLAERIEVDALTLERQVFGTDTRMEGSSPSLACIWSPATCWRRDLPSCVKATPIP